MGVFPTVSLMSFRGGPYPSPRALALIMVVAGFALIDAAPVVPTPETMSRREA